MTVHHGTHRATESDETGGTNGSPKSTESGDKTDHSSKPAETGDESETANGEAVDSLSDDQHREWRRWIVEQFLTSDYGVVPVDDIVGTIREREPSDVERATVRRALTETILPALDRESVLEYDVDRELLINYGT